jgi:ribosomal protein L37AE/L43A
MITAGKETIELRCPYCKGAMEKFWEMSKWWSCEPCKSAFNESDFSNKI